MREHAIREHNMADSAGRFGYTLQVLTYPPHAKQPYRARYARVHNSRALHCGKCWPILVSSAGTPLYATRKETVPSEICVSSQFASPAWRKALADLVIQCSYSHIRHPQNDPTERVMRELAICETCIAKCSGRFCIPCSYSTLRQTQSNPTDRVMRDLAIREPCMAESAGRFCYPVQVLLYPASAE
jgi:hypothetical protein